VRPGGVTQAVESLPSKLEALNSNPSTAKKKKKVFVNFLYCIFVLHPNFEM
jgi:hypothetical protein